MKKFLVMLVALALLPATVEAGGGGGGGAKANAKLNVHNNGSVAGQDLWVVTADSQANLNTKLNAIQGAANPANELANQGGKVAHHGNQAQFSGLKAGKTWVAAVHVAAGAAGPNAAAIDTAVVNISGGGTANLSAEGNANATTLLASF